jgi:hypothetical protein
MKIRMIERFCVRGDSSRSDKIREHAARHGIEIVRTYTDARVNK